MNWEKTVMSDEQIAELYGGMPKYVDVTQRMLAEAQAKISFKAGMKAVVEWVEANSEYYCCSLCDYDRHIYDKKWQAFLKRLGIDG